MDATPAARPWTRRQIAAATIAQVVGLGVAWISFWIAFFLLPPDAFLSGSGERTPMGSRLVGGLAAIVAAVGLPAGLWVVARVRESRVAAMVAGAVAVAVLVVACLWALQP